MKTTCYRYADLEKTVRVFASGVLNVLFVIGSPGQSKSTIVRKALPKAKFIKGGGVTAFQLYRELWYARDRDIILDDVEKMYQDKGLVQLLKAMCETEDVKSIQWMTAAHQLDAEGIEKEFTTKSRVVIILNESGRVNEQVASLEDRGLMVYFRPPVEEVMAVGKKFVKDREVLRFVDERRPFIDQLSLRALVIASQLKAAGLDWQTPLVESLGIKLVLLAKEISEDASLIGERDKLAAWGERTGVNGRVGMGRQAYFTYVRRYRDLELMYTPAGKIKKSARAG